MNTFKYNLFNTCLHASNNNLNHFELLRNVYERGLFQSNKNKILSKMIDLTKNINNSIKSQLYQDVFALLMVGDNYDKTFLEFGATDGLELSNTYLLESEFNWKGVLCEPSPQWHEVLFKNRPKTKIVTDCIWNNSNEKLNFFVSEVGVLSTLEDFKESDRLSMPGNTNNRIEKGNVVTVNTVSLNDLISKEFQGKCPSYISIDTEGSEYEILKGFEFKKYNPICFTIEHNFTNLEKYLDDLMSKNNYSRIFREITAFDGWYIRNDVLNKLEKDTSID